VVRDGRVSHVLVPIAEYERMIESDMIDTAIRRLGDPQDQWVEAGQAAMELAGQRIAQARKAAGLTQKQLGDKLKLPQSQISRIERNPDHTTVRTLKRVAHALGVDVAALLG
jgi:HTH-type transcriptional regulator/antitoxin HipB